MYLIANLRPIQHADGTPSVAGGLKPPRGGSTAASLLIIAFREGKGFWHLMRSGRSWRLWRSWRSRNVRGVPRTGADFLRLLPDIRSQPFSPQVQIHSKTTPGPSKSTPGPHAIPLKLHVRSIHYLQHIRASRRSDAVYSVWN